MNTNIPDSGRNVSTTIYYDRGNTRTETFMEGAGTGVVIYKADEQALYKYEEGSGEGVRVINVDIKSAEETGLMMDLSSDLSEQNIAGISDDVIARVEDLNGEEVVYIENTISDEEKGESTVKMWYSVQYGVSLKREMIVNGEVFMSLETVEIEKDINIDKQWFVILADINFQDVTIDALMEE